MPRRKMCPAPEQFWAGALTFDFLYLVKNDLGVDSFNASRLE